MQAFEPRKKPVQGRSKATVDAILEATIRVLVDGDFDTLTTTRVAEVAGVGVGTLYQYFPAKESLLFALLEREMSLLEAALQGAAIEALALPLEGQVEAIVDALIRYKKRHATLGVALHAHLPRYGGVRLVRSTVRRIITAFAAMLRPHMPSASDAEVELMALVVTTSVKGAIDGALELSPSTVTKPAFRDELVRLVLGYLGEPRSTGR